MDTYRNRQTADDRIVIADKTQKQHIQWVDNRPSFGMYQTLQTWANEITPDLRQFISSSNTPVIQRTITIGNQKYTNGATTRISNLFKRVVAPQLLLMGYKAYRIQSLLLLYIREENAGATFDDETEFLSDFMDWLFNQTVTTKTGKEKPVLQPFYVESLSRPNWPEEYKAELEFIKNIDNIRHVIRNATFKRALAVDFSNLINSIDSTGTSTKIYSDIRIHYINFMQRLNLIPDQQLPDTTTPVEKMIRQIYVKMYLNLSNLFAGCASVNQIIGFASDPVRKYGEKLLKEGDTLLDAKIVFDSLVQIITNAASKVNIEDDNKRDFLNDIFQFLESVYNSNGGLISASIIAPSVINLGLNFGFDLIDGHATADQDNIKKRQYALFHVERQLQQFIESDGKSGDLIEIAKQFLEIKRAENKESEVIPESNIQEKIVSLGHVILNKPSSADIPSIFNDIDCLFIESIEQTEDEFQKVVYQKNYNEKLQPLLEYMIELLKNCKDNNLISSVVISFGLNIKMETLLNSDKTIEEIAVNIIDKIKFSVEEDGAILHTGEDEVPENENNHEEAVPQSLKDFLTDKGEELLHSDPGSLDINDIFNKMYTSFNEYAQNSNSEQIKRTCHLLLIPALNEIKEFILTIPEEENCRSVTLGRIFLGIGLNIEKMRFAEWTLEEISEKQLKLHEQLILYYESGAQNNLVSAFNSYFEDPKTKDMAADNTSNSIRGFGESLYKESLLDPDSNTFADYNNIFGTIISLFDENLQQRSLADEKKTILRESLLFTLAHLASCIEGTGQPISSTLMSYIVIGLSDNLKPGFILENESADFQDRLARFSENCIQFLKEPYTSISISEIFRNFIGNTSKESKRDLRLVSDEEILQETGGNTYHHISGKNNDCFIRSVLTALKDQGAPIGDIEQYVSEVAQWANDNGVRSLGKMINAADWDGIQITQYISDTFLSGTLFDIIICSVGLNGTISTFTLTPGGRPISIKLVYRPLHFDYIS